MEALDSERLHPSTPVFLMQLPTKDRKEEGKVILNKFPQAL
jgi:hypothetical protein